MLNWKKLVVGELSTNCYLVWSPDKTAVIIDPGDDGTDIAQEINELGLRPMMIILTHGHFDHMLGALDLKLIFNVPIAMSSEDVFLVDRAGETAKYFLKREIVVPKIKKIDKNFESFTKFRIQNEEMKIIPCPGHTPGGVSIYAPESKLLFTGDTLFAHGFRGDTKHKYSSNKLIFRSICNLLKLPPEVTVLPGHGEETSIGETKNMFNCDYCELPGSY